MIVVLRLGKRPERDHRINTHLVLVARAFGAKKLIMFFKDPALMSSLAGVEKRFGGDFEIEIRNKIEWRKVIANWNGVIVHLTMYGIPLDEGIIRLHEIEDTRDVLVIIGGKKVPVEIFHRADVNIAVGNQPHSEVAALGLFLDRYFQGKQLQQEMKGWKYKIVPQEKGKMIVSGEDNKNNE